MKLSNAFFVLILGSLSLPAFSGALTQSGFSYLSTTPEIHYQVTVNHKTIVSAELVVEDVGGIAPRGHQVASAELIAQKHVPSTFSFSKPDSGWPEGVYKIIVRDDEKIIETVMFNVIPESDAAIVSGHDQSSQYLAEGVGGRLTEENAHAYVDALEFIHSEMGQPKVFSHNDRQAIISNLASSFSSFPSDLQRDLSNARSLLTQYQSSWHSIGSEEQRAFAYSVLAIAYGEQSASQALGYGQGGSGGSSGGSSYYSDGASYVSDGNCAYFSSEYGSISSCD